MRIRATFHPPLYHLTSPSSSSMARSLLLMAMALVSRRSDLNLSMETKEACFACKPITLLDLGINREAVGEIHMYPETIRSQLRLTSSL